MLDLQASLADAPTLHLDTASASKHFDYVNHTEGKKHRVWFDDDETLSIKYRAVLDAGVAGIAMWTADATHRVGPSDTRAASTVSHSAGCPCRPACREPQRVGLCEQAMWYAVSRAVQRSKSDDDEPGAAASTVFGSWHRFLPLLDTNHSAAAPSAGNITATLLTLKATNQRLFGLDVSSCQALALFARFLAEAERIYPELRVFACLSSHSPIFEYCAAYWDTSGPAKGLEVNWTQTGHLVAAHTVGRPNFHGLCEPRATQHAHASRRHVSSIRATCAQTSTTGT